MTRRESRICVFELLYESIFHSDESYEQIYERSLGARDEKGSEFAKNLFLICTENAKEIDDTIASVAENWKVSRMSAVTKAILRLCVGEILYTDVPPKVAINEAVEIAKLYDDDKAPGFVNGILNKVAHATGKIANND